MVGVLLVEQQRDMAKKVMEDIGFDDVIEFLGLPEPYGDRESLVRQVGEKRHFGDESGDGHDLPASRGTQPLRDFIKARDSATRIEGGERVVVFGACIPWDQL